MPIEDLLRRVGDAVNAFGSAASNFPSDVATAFKPQGLLSDLGGFAMQGLTDYGQKTFDYQRRLADAFGDIQAGKSPELGPLVQEAINVNPIMAGTWGPIRTPGQKQAVRALWRHSPEDVMAVEQDPRMLTLTAPKGNVLAKAQQAENTGWMPEGSAAAFDPVGNELRVAPGTMVGGHYKAPLEEGLSDLTKALGLALPDSWLKPRIVTAPGGTTNLPEAIGHETQHFLNRPRLYSQTENEVADMYLKMAPYLSKHARQAALEGAEQQKDMGVALDEMLAYLSGKSTRNPETEDVGRILNQLLRTRTSPGGNVGPALTPKSIEQAIGFAQRMAHPDPVIQQAATSQWDRLAAEGKLGMREGTYREQAPYKDLLWSKIADRTEPATMYDRLPRAGRTFVSAGDLSRQAAGETLPALGSAMPDIPRPVSSPGALDFFENLRKKLGLPEADLGGAAPEFYGKKTPPSSLLESKRGADALEELYQNWKEITDMPAPPTQKQRYNARGIAMGPMLGSQMDRDAFMADIISHLVEATRRTPAFEGLSQGVTGFRRAVAPVEGQAAVPMVPLSKGKTLDILGHLQEQGMMDPRVLKQAAEIGGGELNPTGLDRIKRMLERIEYDPVTGNTKGKPAGLLKSKRGGQALEDLYKNWLEMSQRYNISGGQVGVPDPTIGMKYPREDFIKDVLGHLSWATQPNSLGKFSGSPTGGIKGFRGDLRMMGPGYSNKLPPDMTLNILEQLKESGFLNRDAIERALSGHTHGLPTTNEQGLEYIRRLLERTGR